MKYLKIIGFVLLSVLALYFNAFYLIFVLAILYSVVTRPNKPVQFSSGLFVVSFLTWSVLILVSDMSFYNSPSATLAQVLGGLSSWLVPVFGGLIGGILAFLGSLGGAYMVGRES